MGAYDGCWWQLKVNVDGRNVQCDSGTGWLRILFAYILARPTSPITVECRLWVARLEWGCLGLCVYFDGEAEERKYGRQLGVWRALLALPLPHRIAIAGGCCYTRPMMLVLKTDEWMNERRIWGDGVYGSCRCLVVVVVVVAVSRHGVGAIQMGWCNGDDSGDGGTSDQTQLWHNTVAWGSRSK